MEREERGYFAYRKFGDRLVIVFHPCLERAQRGEKVKWQWHKGRKSRVSPLHPQYCRWARFLVTPYQQTASFSLYFHSQIETERPIYYRYY